MDVIYCYLLLTIWAWDTTIVSHLFNEQIQLNENDSSVLSKVKAF